MSLADFRVMETVGKGSFASVYKVNFWMHGYINRFSSRCRTIAFVMNFIGDKEIGQQSIRIKTSEDWQNVQERNF